MRSTDRTCLLCGQRTLKSQASLKGRGIYRCWTCRLVQMLPVPTSLPRGDDYLGFDLERHRAFLRLFWIPKYRAALDLIKYYQKEGRLLDVGCGTGEFLELARENGFSPYGIEPSETAYLIARRKNPVIRGELKELNFKENMFDVVTLWSVLEHVPDPQTFLHQIHALLKPQGLLALRIPSAQSLLYFLALTLHRASAGTSQKPLNILFQLDWHYKHFFLFAKDSVGFLLRLTGFSPLILKRDTGYDVKSMDCRMGYLPRNKTHKTAVKAALFILLGLSTLFRKQDELIVLARKNG